MADTSMEELSNSELQDELIKLGFPEEAARTFKLKAQIIATINTLKAKEASAKVDSLEPTIDPVEEKNTEIKWASKADKQWAYWMTKPKIRIMVPLTGQEKQGIVKWVMDQKLKREVPVHVGGAMQQVTENGAVWIIPKGVYVDVPEPVAKIIQDKFQQTSEAGANLLIDRVDPETGKPVRDRLS